MKLQKAIEISSNENLVDCVNGIILHCMNLFCYEDINKELKELQEDAEAQGIEFCKCGFAKTPDDKNRCQMCIKI